MPLFLQCIDGIKKGVCLHSVMINENQSSLCNKQDWIIIDYYILAVHYLLYLLVENLTMTSTIEELTTIIQNAKSLVDSICEHETIKAYDRSESMLVNQDGHDINDVQDFTETQTNQPVQTSTTKLELFGRIEEANNIIQEIDNEVLLIDKAVRAEYRKRFPELTIASPVQYFRVVKILANEPNIALDEQVKANLADILDPKTHFLVVMSAGTTAGTKMEPEDMDKVLQACSIALILSELRQKLLNFVESNMTKVAPNLSILLGPSIAAKLMSQAGGLTLLSTMPSCNLSFLGSSKETSLGVSSIDAPFKKGSIYHCDLVQQIPVHIVKDVRKRAVRLLASKCSLAARMDVNQSNQDGSYGLKIRQEIEKKIEKELEPPPAKAARPLPAPIDKASKKRGGKRVRRMKEKYADTALRRAGNRINFGDVAEDTYQNDIGIGQSQLSSMARRVLK